MFFLVAILPNNPNPSSGTTHCSWIEQKTVDVQKPNPHCTSWCETRFDNILRFCTTKKKGRRVPNIILGPEVSNFFDRWHSEYMKWLISTSHVSILNIAKRCNVFHVFSLGICSKYKRTTWVCLKTWRPSLKSRFVLAENECYLGPSCWDKCPQKSHHIIPHLFPLLLFWLWKHISKIQSQKRSKKHISNHEYKHCLIYFPDSGVVPEISNVKGPVNLKFAVYIGVDEILLSYIRIIISQHKPLTRIPSWTNQDFNGSCHSRVLLVIPVAHEWNLDST